MAMAIVILVGCVSAWLLVWGMCLIFDSITNTSWDITWSEIAEWLRSPKFLKGLGIFLSSFPTFGLMFWLALLLLA